MLQNSSALTVLTSILTLSISIAAPAEAQKPSWAEAADKIIAEVSTPGEPGGAVGVVVEGELVYSRGFGYANLDHQVANTPDTVFDIASCAKQFTAASALLLAEDGKLDLEGDIRQILPELALEDAVPVHRLMTHTSGLQDFSELQILARGRDFVHTYSPDEVDRLINAQRSRSAVPGERTLYSNTNYLLLARIVERVSGQSLREFAHQRLFEPLGMTSTYFRDNHREPWPHQSTGYYRDGESGSFRMELQAHPRGLPGAGGLSTSVNDLAKWVANFMDPKVGGQRLIDELTRPATLSDGTTLDVARGLMLGTMGNQRWVEHTGHSNVNNSLISWWPDADVGIIVLTNHGGLNPYQISNPLLRPVLGDKLVSNPASEEESGDGEAEKKVLKLSASEMRRYEGTYPADFPVGRDRPPHGGVGVLRIAVEDGQLKAHLPIGFAAELRAIDPLTFDLMVPGHSITFTFEGLGTPDQAFHFHQGGESSGPHRKLSPPDAGVLEAYVGSYKAPDLLDSVPLRITREGERLFMHWGQLQIRQEVFLITPERLTTYSDKMQCNLVFTVGEDGRPNGFSYEGHRVWNLRFERI